MNDVINNFLSPIGMKIKDALLKFRIDVSPLFESEEKFANVDSIIYYVFLKNFRSKYVDMYFKNKGIDINIYLENNIEELIKMKIRKGIFKEEPNDFILLHSLENETLLELVKTSFERMLSVSKSKIESFDSILDDMIIGFNVKKLNPELQKLIKDELTSIGNEFLDISFLFLLFFLSYNELEFKDNDLYENCINYYKLSLKDFERFLYKEIKTKIEEISQMEIDPTFEQQKEMLKFLNREEIKLLKENGSIINIKVMQDKRINPLIGRENEIENLIFVLSKKDKPNAILVGEPGVGKTQIVYGFAKRINENNVIDEFKNKIIYSLNVNSLVSDTMLRGQFEGKIKDILNILIDNKDKMILFIDEIHTLFGAGGNYGTGDTANILKPYLTSGDLFVIGATTFKEYKSIIEKDKAFERRFQKIVIKEPSIKETLKILHGIKNLYEEFHNVIVDNSIIDLIVSLSKKYIIYRNFPDKAIDVLDQICVKTKLEKREKPNEEDVKYIISKITNIPVREITEEEKDRLIRMESILSTRVFGQNHAIKEVCDSVIISKLGFNTRKKPIASFLFLGPTGVGKTELAKSITEFLFFNEENMLRIDMSELMHSHSISKLIGTTAGYIGYDETNMLTDKIKDNPNQVILLDEIEKAHPRVLDLFLQILDEGYINDARGEKINFENTIIIMTSNIGSDKINKDHLSIGFSNSLSNKLEIMDSLIKKELKTFLRPEFINRIDKIITFNKLSIDILSKIFDKEIKELNKISQEKHKVSIIISNNLKNYLLKSIDMTMGARPIKRIIESKIKNELVRKILFNEVKENDIIYFDLNENKINIKISKEEVSIT